VYEGSLIGCENYPKNKVTETGYENNLKVRVTDITFKYDDISGYASSRPVATKMFYALRHMG